MKTFYRLQEQDTIDGVIVLLHIWREYKQTPEGYWALNSYAPEGETFDWYKRCKFLRWIPKHGQRYACESLDRAISQFLLRKRKQLGHLKRQLKVIQTIVDNKHKLEGATLESFDKDYQHIVIEGYSCELPFVIPAIPGGKVP